MTIFNLGSINADLFYQVPHIPAPGETLAATDHSTGLGGKGANQSVAMAKAGADIRHIGAVGRDGQWMVKRLTDLGVNTDSVMSLDLPSGHAVVTVAADGENAITLFPGANQAIPQDHLKLCLLAASTGDWLVMQNETNAQAMAAQEMKARRGKVAYSAAPFDVDAISPLLGSIDLLAVNEGEAAALVSSLDLDRIEDVPVPMILVTYGADGAAVFDTEKGQVIRVDGMNIQAKDSTGAGDTFFGFFLATLDRTGDVEHALDLANRAAALKVTRPGTADAIPGLAEVEVFQP